MSHCQRSGSGRHRQVREFAGGGAEHHHQSLPRQMRRGSRDVIQLCPASHCVCSTSSRPRYQTAYHQCCYPDTYYTSTRVLDTDQCQVHQVTSTTTGQVHQVTSSTPLMDRRQGHRTLPHSQYQYHREYDVSSIVSEIEQLSLYSSSSRKQSLVVGDE